jgi:hypothetical protein
MLRYFKRGKAMTTPYTIEALDALMRACIEFTDHHDQDFYAAIIAVEGLDSDQVRRMMDWVVKTDNGLLEYRGFGTDNVEYFRLGPDAKQMMGDGGFKWYLRNKAKKGYLEFTRLWAPIFISLAALAVSSYGALNPKDEAKKIDKLEAQLNALQRDHDQTRSMVVEIRQNVDTISSRLPKKRDHAK